MSKLTPEHDGGAPHDSWDATLYDTKHSFVWQFGEEIVELLEPKHGERILDVGCGTGHLTAKIALSGADVVGIDNAPTMIEQARRSYPNLTFEVADARRFSFLEPFDAVFSNAALHWIKEADLALASISRCLRPQGRFVAEMGGKGNIQAIVTAIYTALDIVGAASNKERNPFFFPSIGDYGTLLERHSLFPTLALLFPRPTPLENGQMGLRDWMEMFATDLLAGLSADMREEVIRLVEEELRPHLYRDGQWIADYWRLRVVAIKQAAG